MRLAITAGDPAGVGPELALRLLSEPPHGVVPIAVGSGELFRRVAEASGMTMEVPVMSLEELQEAPPSQATILDLAVEGMDSLVAGAPSSLSGQAAYQWLTAAIGLAQEGRVDGIVTSPLSKEALHLGGHFYDGHTEILVEQTQARQHAMMLTAPEVTAALVTTHIAVSEVSTRLSVERICEVTRLTAEALPLWGLEQDSENRMKVRDRPPRLAVLGLNPHAGENGLFGDEEARVIQPAIDQLRSEGFDLVGPLPADTAFIPALRKGFDGYICMYHDQGLIPLKTLAFDHAVNVTLGLPIVRTSVDHGTAYDLAWQGQASAQSLYAACEAAKVLAERRKSFKASA